MSEMVTVFPAAEPIIPSLILLKESAVKFASTAAISFPPTLTDEVPAAIVIAVFPSEVAPATVEAFVSANPKELTSPLSNAATIVCDVLVAAIVIVLPAAVKAAFPSASASAPSSCHLLLASSYVYVFPS